ncbi:MAG: stage III sporulation protein AB [Lachnospiraceae bacterium]|nr:stage III sporulation protein AB [Lachnospiraceae bacterium]
MKQAGLILIFCACCGAGFRMSRLLTSRCAQLGTLKRIVIMLRGEVKHNHSDLTEAFAVISGRLNPGDVFRGWLEFLCELLRKRDGRTLQELFEESVEKKLGTDSDLNRADLEKLCGLGENLGYLDIGMQLATMDFYLEQLEADLREAEGHLKEQKRLCQCLGVAGGLFVVLLLI